MISALDIRRARFSIRASDALSLHAPEEAAHPNEAQAAHAFMRAARLNAVANGIIDKLSTMVAVLEGELLKELRRHAPLTEAELPSLFQQFERLVDSAFERMAREAEDDMVAVHQAAFEQGARAMSAHLKAVAETADRGSREALVLGAPLADHFDKMASDTLFRLKAAIRQGVADGDDEKQLEQRIAGGGVASIAKGKVRGQHLDHHVIHAETPPASVLIRLLDATDNSLAKVAKAAVTAFADAADEALVDAVPDDSGPARMGFCWVSAQDGSVCDFCEFYDGNLYDENKEPVGDSPELEREPPAHYGCRCALVPCDLDGERPQGTFDDYLDQFSDQEQRSAFGDRSLEAYRKGTIGPGALMNQDDHAMTIEEFKKGEPELRFDLSKYERMGEEGARQANERTMQRRAGL